MIKRYSDHAANERLLGIAMISLAGWRGATQRRSASRIRQAPCNPCSANREPDKER
jgi:hypothetical protein